MTLAKVKKQDGMTLAKVKEQDGMTLAKVIHAQVSHASHCSAKYPYISGGLCPSYSVPHEDSKK